MQAMVARLPQITNMSVEAILATDLFIPLGQPTAPSETLPFKSGIKVTRKKPITTPLIPVAEIVTLPNDDFEIRVEPSTSTPIKTSSKPSTRSKPSTSAKAKPSTQSKPSTSAQAKPLAQSKPSAQPSTSAQTESSSSAQHQLSDHEDHSTDDHDEPQASTTEAIEILDFSNVLPPMPKNVYTEFYDIFPV